MQRPLDLIEELRDVVHIQPGPRAQRTSLDLERVPRAGSRGSHQATPKGIVHHVPERSSSPAGQRPELRGDILIERQRSAHTMMLQTRHHDVKARPEHAD